MNDVIAHPVETYKTLTWKLKYEWRWRVRANNGKIIASSSEGYINKGDMENNMKSTFASLDSFFGGGVNYRQPMLTLERK